MPTPREPGFTGVDWHARTTERLATDLLGGAGAQPITTAAQETARLASAYGSAAVALDRLIVRLDGAIDTGAESATERRTGPLPDYARWLAKHSADLAEYAAKLAGQAAAYDTAARAMPSVADAERMRAERQNAQAAAAAGGHEPAAAALVGAAAERERAEQQGHVQAAAVMVGFERAAHPLREPWEMAPPPTKAKGKPKRENKTKSTQSAGAAKSGGGGVPGMATPLSVFPVTALARDAAATTRPASVTTSSGTGGRGMPMMPAGMMGAAGAGAAAKQTSHTPGAVASDPADELPEAFVVHAAPAVLGAGVEQAVEDV